LENVGIQFLRHYAEVRRNARDFAPMRFSSRFFADLSLFEPQFEWKRCRLPQVLDLQIPDSVGLPLVQEPSWPVGAGEA
jgi:hypothetical protein